jgi:O-acetyl-ADP-ribose deacetylase (regulator of RNase III)
MTDNSIKIVLDYLNATYEEPKKCFINGRDKIRYYMTKNFVVLPPEINKLMNEVLRNDIDKNKIIDINEIDSQISIIKYDITQIKADVIVNAANADGLGCFEFNHKCIDNIIHNKAGPALRLECKSVLGQNKIETSNAIITLGYNLPCKYIIHTVGPIYDTSIHELCCKQLKKCYSNCLELAINNKLESIVFCCISTGVYGFPADKAAIIAISTIKKFLQQTKSNIKIIFCTYTDNDFKLYQNII